MKTDHEEIDFPSPAMFWVREWAKRKGVDAQVRCLMAELLSGAVADGRERRYMTHGSVDLDLLHRAALKSFNKPAEKRRAKHA